MTRRMPLLLALALAFAAAVPAVAGHDRRRPQDPVQALEQQGRRQAERLDAALQEASDLALQLPPCSVRDALLAELDTAMELNERQDATRARLVELAAAAPVVVVPRGPAAIAPEDFAVIVAAVDRLHWDDDRLQLVRDATRGRAFTTAQVRALMRLMQWGDGKIEVAVLLRPQTVDPENFWQVGDELTWSSDRAKLRQRLG